MAHPLLTRNGLYAITDGPRDDLLAACEAAIDGGAVLLQYRDKTEDENDSEADLHGRLQRKLV